MSKYFKQLIYNANTKEKKRFLYKIRCNMLQNFILLINLKYNHIDKLVAKKNIKVKKVYKTKLLFILINNNKAKLT